MNADSKNEVTPAGDGLRRHDSLDGVAVLSLQGMNSGAYEVPLPRFATRGFTFAAAAVLLLAMALPELKTSSAPAQQHGLSRDDRQALCAAGAASVVTALESAQASFDLYGGLRPEQCERAQRRVFQALKKVDGPARIALGHAHTDLKRLGCD